MNTVNYLAQIWGILMTIISLTMLINEKNLKSLLSVIQTDVGAFFGGLISTIIGVIMVVLYNTWNLSWQVVITIFGWLSLIKGLIQLLMPDKSKFIAQKIESFRFTPYALLVVLAIGLAITYLGFTA